MGVGPGRSERSTVRSRAKKVVQWSCPSELVSGRVIHVYLVFVKITAYTHSGPAPRYLPVTASKVKSLEKQQ